jgi:hypothetical protein
VIDRKAFFDAVRMPLFDGALTQRQVDGMEAILTEWDARGLADLGQLAYILTTAYHETGRAMYPVEEVGKGRGYKYPPYYGRGLVGITWLRNYQLFGKRLGVDLVNQPDLAMRLDYSVTILIEGMLLGLFTGKRLEQFDLSTSKGVYDARVIVNGDKDYPSRDKRWGTRGMMIASYFQFFRSALMVQDAQTDITTTEEVEAVVHDETDTVVMNERDNTSLVRGDTRGVVVNDVDPEYLEWLRQKQAEEADELYRLNNTKPAVSSTVTRFVIAGISSFLAVRFGLTIPPEWQPLIETAIVTVMGAGAVWGRSRATTFISGVFNAKS